jgi:hypothetical protein
LKRVNAQADALRVPEPLGIIVQHEGEPKCSTSVTPAWYEAKRSGFRGFNPRPPPPNFGRRSNADTMSADVHRR